ncbi:MAG TPA: 3'-5' exonuclease, partial [Verrucomicrobiae bacterium]|nr:3'-5' exonuclease [Verrucomicrobiae bacterium]
RNQIKDFFEEAEFLKSLVPKNENDPLAEDWNLVRHGMETLLNLTIEFTGKFDAAKRQSAGLDFADLEQFALRVLRDSETGAPTPAALEWRQRLDYIFVDECQDINAAQDAILTALSRDGADANRFLVGDVKQSIYRFRLADPGIFRRYETNWSNGAPHSQRLPLSDNFRSHKGILDFINPLFRALMRQSFGGVSYEELIFGNAAERAALLEKKIGEPRVEFHLIAKGEPENSTGEENAGDENNEQYGQSTSAADLLATEREARMVAIRLRELKENGREIWDKEKKQFRPVQWSDMAVLLRSPSSRVEAFAKEFDKAGVPLEAARAGFFASAEITDLVCLLKLLDNPLQDIPLLAALHSPLVGMSFSELAEIRANETPASRAKFFWMTARDFHRRGDKSSSAWRKLDAFFAQLHRWRERVRQSSVSHCLETALTETHYELLLRAGIRGEQQIANVRRFLDLARQYDPFQRQGLFRFLRFIQAQEKHDLELDSAPANRDAVRLMSIHKSKGLEFPVVALAGLGWKFNFRDLDENILLDEIFGLCPKVAPAKNAQTYPSLPWWLARRRQRGEMLGEELRLLYVAMTRARDTLLLAATAPRKGNPKWDAAEPREWRDEELLSARCCFDWLKPWFSQMTRETDWTSECGGATQLFRWTIYDENDPRLELKNLERIGSKSFTEKPNHLDESALAKISERVNWIYPWNSATGQRAKTSVTELRRQRDGDEESEIAPFARRNVFTLESKKNGLSAAEIGVAHHRFLQRVSLEKTGGADALKSEAERLRAEKFLSEREVESLDFVALEKFWRSDFGRNIVANAGNVRRELEFSAAFSAADLVATSLASAAKLPPDDFVLVQGIVDLAVILPGEIRIVDFKTDAVTEAELERKTKQYEPQLKLYALALERSFRLPVTQCALYFLSAHRLAQVRI